MSECAERLGVSGTGYKDEKLLDELKDGYWELEQYSGAAGRERTGRIQKILRRCSRHSCKCSLLQGVFSPLAR